MTKKNDLIISIVMSLLGKLLDMITPEMIRSFANKVIDFAEECIEKSENKYDDKLLPVLISLKEALSLEDE